jgi:hypothetical protein
MSGTADGPSQPAATFLVEHFWPGITPDRFTDAADRVRRIADERAGSGTRLRFLHATLVPDDEAAFTVVEAGSRADVEDLYDRAGLVHERILDAVPIRIGTTAASPTSAQERPEVG